MNIAILEDDATLANGLQKLLSEAGHTSQVFKDGDALLRILRRGLFDLYVLDWNVPKATGLDVLIHIRQALNMTEPVIFLTSVTSEPEIVHVLNNGADDYCVKPVRLNEFLARIHSVDRRVARTSVEPTALKTVCGYTFDTARSVVSFDGTELELRDREFALAQLLFSELNRPVPRQKILMTIWGTTADEFSRTLDVHIARIRRHLKLGPENKQVRLSSIYGFGYRLMQIFPDE